MLIYHNKIYIDERHCIGEGVLENATMDSSFMLQVNDERSNFSSFIYQDVSQKYFVETEQNIFASFTSLSTLPC